MKLIMENWRRFLIEATEVPDDQKEGFKQAILASEFWTHSNTIDDVDLMGGEDEFGTPAIEVLMDALNDMAHTLETDLYFLVTVSDEEQYALGPDDPHGGYPNNWMMRGQYRGPTASHGLPDQGSHVLWLEFRSLAQDYDMSALNPGELAKIISRTINHELVHYNQLKKQVANKGVSEEEAWHEMECDPEQVPVTDADAYREKCGREPPEPDDSRAGYLTRHIEVDAFAHEAAEELLDQYSAEEALELIKTRSSNLQGVVGDYLEVLGDKPEELNKFWKKLYTQIMDQSESQ